MTKTYAKSSDPGAGLPVLEKRSSKGIAGLGTGKSIGKSGGKNSSTSARILAAANAMVREHLPLVRLKEAASPFRSTAGATTVPVELQAYSSLQDRLNTRFSSEQVADVSRAFVLARDARHSHGMGNV